MCLPLELYPEQWQEGDEVVLAPGIDARRDLLQHQLCTVTRVYNHAARLIRLTRKSDGKDLGNFETPELARCISLRMRKRCISLLRAWMTTEEAKAGAKFNFPAMSATQRMGMHSVCKGLGLYSDSSGNSRRHVWATLERPKERGKHIPNVLQINTSNNGKFTEFHRVLAELIPSCTLKRTETDVHEILSSVENVSAHKATVCGVGVLVEDTSLDVEAAEGGAEGTAPAVDVGVNVRWFMKELLANSSEFVGRRASWRVILSMMLENSDGSTIVRLYEGVVKGTLVEPRGEGGFGFDPGESVLGSWVGVRCLFWPFLVPQRVPRGVTQRS